MQLLAFVTVDFIDNTLLPVAEVVKLIPGDVNVPELVIVPVHETFPFISTAEIATQPILRPIVILLATPS